MRKKNDNKIICTSCGKEILDESLFCQYCGKKVEKQAIQEIDETAISEPNKNKSTKKVKEANILESKENRNNHAFNTFETSNDLNKSAMDEYLEAQRLLEEKGKAQKRESFEKKKKYIYPVVAVFITFAMCLSAFALFYRYYLKNLVIETTKREVTISDTGISESVDKVYDSVVVVESYVKKQLYATGTGFVYKTDDASGYILTNSHVIEGADEVKVVFTNNKREEVDIVGSDSYSDIALLGIDKDKIVSVAEIGNSEDLKLGDTTFAVGSPLDSETYAWTVTRGILSGKNRTVAVSSSGNKYAASTSVMQVLQTDAAINSGNSGGPLCNSNGQVIGITNMKLASSTVEGMGFAIPIEIAVKYADKFISGEKVSYPYIGVTIYDAVPTYRNPDASGVYVEMVEKNSPADRAGLKSGDKILKVNKADISDSSFFKYELYKYNIGDKIEITVERNGKEKVLTVTLGSSNASA